MPGVSSSGGRAKLLVKQKQSATHLQINLGFLRPMEQQGHPILQSISSVRTGFPIRHSMGFSPTLRQNSSLRQQHSLTLPQPIFLAMSVEIKLLQQKKALHTSLSALSEEKMDI